MTFKQALSAAFSLSSIALLCPGLHATPTDDGLYAVFDTDQGSFTAALFFEKAPLSSANFVGLAEGTLPHYQNGSNEPIYSKFYDGLTFHRAVPDFVIQGGDPAGNGSGGPGYEWPDEVRPDLKHVGEGVLSMANSGANTNGSQFFITLDATSNLDGLHNVFGDVVEGIETVRAIGELPNGPPTNALNPPVKINSVSILRIGEAANAFDPAFYAHHFDPTIDIFGQETTTETHVSLADASTFTVSTPFAPLTEYRVLTSDDLDTWNEVAYLPPSLAPGASAPSVQLSPQEDGAPRFARIDTTKRRISDMSEVFQELTIESETDGTSYLETLTIRPNLLGTYQINDSSEFPVFVDWFEISATRSQVRVIFYRNINGFTQPYSSNQYFLDRSEGLTGSVYLRDQNSTLSEPRDDILDEGTFTLTPAE